MRGSANEMTNATGIDGHRNGEANKLINERSPYLLQHAYNPVDWHAWNDEAFEKARKEDKPIFLSIGYSTCHWCHVMEHESFEDSTVAQLMNDAFVCIKVDREERPDIDNIYMTVCQMMTGSGGWPLTIVMTPDKKPFFAATYIPKETRFNRMGMIELIPRIADVWQNRRQEVLQSADKITAGLRRSSEHAESGRQLSDITLTAAFDDLKGSFDDRHGGFGAQRKFPIPHNLLFLLRYWDRTGEDRALSMVEQTLAAMRLGGIFDHVGYGFHRYSTDPQWLLPHFEKMLYDQALIAMAYTEAYQVTGKQECANTARETFSYVLRDMTSPNGGFYSAEDADSEGEEGKFYVWTDTEVRDILDADEAEAFTSAYNIQPEGNFKEESTGHATGTNIPHFTKSLAEIAKEMGVEELHLSEVLKRSRVKLFEHREKRIHPLKDDKILTDWNGLMIAALSKAAQVFNDEEYLTAATRSADFLLDSMRTDGGALLHRYREGSAEIDGYVDDYAFLIWGLIELYETTFDVKYLRAAIELNGYLIEHFWDESEGGFFFTADDSEELIHRTKDIYDGAVPSGNSVGMLNLLRLGKITADASLEQRAAQLAETFSGSVSRSPSNFTQMMIALDFATGSSYEVVIVGKPDSKDTKDMLAALTSQYAPNKVVLLKPTDQSKPDIAELAEYTGNHSSIDGKSTAYVCLNYNCKLPTTDPDEMLRLLKETKSR